MCAKCGNVPKANNDFAEGGCATVFPIMEDQTVVTFVTPHLE